MIRKCIDVLDTRDNAAAGQQQARHHQFLHGIGVGTGRIEDDDALIGEVRHGDVIYTSTGPTHGAQR